MFDRSLLEMNNACGIKHSTILAESNEITVEMSLANDKDQVQLKNKKNALMLSSHSLAKALTHTPQEQMLLAQEQLLLRYTDSQLDSIEYPMQSKCNT